MSQPRVLVVDIERMKGVAEVEFWDLGDFKNRRIHADDVRSYPRTICAAWRFKGDRTVQFASEWDDGPVNMAQRLWDAYDEANIVVGHNLIGFDTKKLMTDWLERGMGSPSPWKSVDTLKVARQLFGMESNTLDAICQRLNIPAKVDHYNVEVARAACDGNKTAQRRITRYNKGDIIATEALYDTLLGYMPNHPHMGLFVNDGRPACANCGKYTLTKQGTRKSYTARQVYQQYRCTSCGHWDRGRTILDRVEVPA